MKGGNSNKKNYNRFGNNTVGCTKYDRYNYSCCIVCPKYNGMEWFKTKDGVFCTGTHERSGKCH